MEKICMQCGDVGYREELVYCVKCKNYCLHSYCMDVLPCNKDHQFHWLCDDCEEEKLSNESCGRMCKIKNETLIPEEKQKKDHKGNQSGRDGNSFIYSFADQKKLNSEKPAVGVEQKHLSINKNLQIPDKHVQPLIISVWTGCFNLNYNKHLYTNLNCFSAYLSSKAREKSYMEAIQFQPVLHFEMVPSSCIWPGNSEESGLTEDDIELYFFPSLMIYDESIYECIICEMLCEDLAMRASLQDSELLVFPSTHLPIKLWRFQGKFYLWGMFRGK